MIDFKLADAILYLANLPLESELVKPFQAWIPEKYQDAVSSRKDEFLAGRYCAASACELLGEKLESLDVDEQRRPIWPAHLSGSISHTKGYACAIVGKREDYKSLGVDIEKIIIDRRMSLVENKICTDSDLDFLKEKNLLENKVFYTIIFSAKEALFKAINPLNQEYFDFKEADIVQLDQESISFKLNSDKESLKAFDKTYKVYFHLIDEEAVITYLALT